MKYFKYIGTFFIEPLKLHSNSPVLNVRGVLRVNEFTY